jgi:L-iditol 2-dehydrogenase
VARTILPTVTRAAVYEGHGRVEVREMPLPSLGPGELLVKIRACGLCASETLRWYADAKAPFVLGHEPVAEIVACGPDAAPRDGGGSFRPGERVFVHHHAPCMQCRRCLRGDHVQCATWRATRLVPGGLSQYAVVPATNARHDVLRVPEGLTDEEATLVEPLATVLKSVRRSGLRRGDHVAIIGLGVMGLLHLVAARAAGAQTMIGADRVAWRLERARLLGADVVINGTQDPIPAQVRSATGGEGAEVVFVTPGSGEALQTGVECVARGGTLVAFTPTGPGERWSVDVGDLFFKDISIVTSYSAGPMDTREALTLLAKGLPVAPLFTHRFELEEAAEAYAALKDADRALKVLVYPHARPA